MRREHGQTWVSHDLSAVVRPLPIIQRSVVLPSQADPHLNTSVKLPVQTANSQTNILLYTSDPWERQKEGLREKSDILTAVQSRWSWRCYSLASIWEERNLSPFLSSGASVFLPSLRTHLFLISVLSSRVSSNVRGQHAVPECWLHLHLEIHICGETNLPQVLWKGSAHLYRTLMRPPSENVTANVPGDATFSLLFSYFKLLLSVKQRSSESPSQTCMYNVRTGCYYLTLRFTQKWQSCHK